MALENDNLKFHQEYDNDKNLIREFWLDEKNLMQKTCKTFDIKNKTVESTMDFKDGILNGKLKKFTKGKLVAEIDFLMGVMNGKMKLFDDDVLTTSFSFVDDKLHGPMKSWDKNSQLTTLKNYENGLSHGFTYTYYIPDSEITQNQNTSPKTQSICHYYNGNKQGVWQLFYENGNPMEEGSFKNGKKHGTFISYYPDGNVSQKIHYQDGKIIDTGLHLDPSGYEIL